MQKSFFGILYSVEEIHSFVHITQRTMNEVPKIRNKTKQNKKTDNEKIFQPGNYANSCYTICI